MFQLASKTKLYEWVLKEAKTAHEDFHRRDIILANVHLKNIDRSGTPHM